MGRSGKFLSLLLEKKDLGYKLGTVSIMILVMDKSDHSVTEELVLESDVCLYVSPSLVTMFFVSAVNWDILPSWTQQKCL